MAVAVRSAFFTPLMVCLCVFDYFCVCRIGRGCGCRIIKGSFYGIILLSLVCAIIAFATPGNIAAGVFILLMGIWAFVFYRLVEPRVPFASVIIEMACSIISANMGAIYVAYAFLIVQIGWVGFWGYVVPPPSSTGHSMN